MRLRTAKSLLIVAAAIMGCASMAIIVWPAVSPLPRTTPTQVQSPEKIDGAGLPFSPIISRAAFDQVASLDLRRPLHDPPPPPPPAPEAPKAIPPLAIRLSGTIFEPGHCRAVVLLPDGRVQLLGIGERAGDATILEIGNGTVKVDYFGQSLTLMVPEEKHG
jgi:hypothetical protein